MKDIETRSDIEIMVNMFYDKIVKDNLLSPFFKNLNFEKHLPKMVDFWAFVLLDEVGYRKAPSNGIKKRTFCTMVEAV